MLGQAVFLPNNSSLSSRVLAQHLLLDRVFLVEVHADTVDAMPLVRRCGISLSFENVAEMASTVRTHNLDPLHAECAVRVPCDSSGKSVEECRPAAARLELVVCLVKRCIASGTCVHSLGGHVLVVLSGEWSFGALSS